MPSGSIAEAPPILDFSVIYGNDAAAKSELVETVKKCCLRNGFFQIVGHKVPRQLQQDVLDSVKSFFSLPQELKEKVHKDNTTWNRGFESIGSQILEAGTNPDLKEGFYIGEEISKSHPYFTGKKLNSGPNQWPTSSSTFNAEKFRHVSMEYYTHMHTLAREVLSVIALTLDLPEDYFQTFTTGAVATLRYLHYPPQPPTSDEKLTRGIGAHTDFGSITLLMQDEVDGLQVYEKSTDEWLDVTPTPGAYVVNLGNMFMRWSNDLYISNLHRVINKSGRERYSVPFFFSGHPDYVIDCLPNCRKEGEKKKYEPITVMDCVGGSYRESYGKAKVFKEQQASEKKDVGVEMTSPKEIAV
ncbi:2-oxoglutarate-Fe(II) type oxidoreductase hxnY [Pseudocercospora fuligena]|uniref:2-oxoglutarate-Fe(II) type oxidoreductase hxnY n=1 Tax=Pseudocercospora fuligena TaxID=685502 RepID=A0A8H6VF75_9PEZI|nr:2-oxoglutarate-Fe(II) type oxidoreductase hxnY [Pseudocercospora fuligena]